MSEITPSGDQSKPNTDAGQQGASGTPEGAAGETSSQQGQQGAAQDQKPVVKAPEKYDLKAPEGVEFHPKAMEQFSTLAKKLDLSNEHAQELSDFLVGMNGERVKEWTAQTEADKEFGGAENLRQTVLPIAEKALAAFGTPELSKLLKGTGFSNHPEVIRLFHRIGSAIKEDDVHTGGSDTSSTDAATLLYGKSGNQ